jgi:hypothetical protein
MERCIAADGIEDKLTCMNESYHRPRDIDSQAEDVGAGT